jgi:primosomal protein N' (replication factor Y)
MKHDVDGFHAYELAQRSRLGYPPFTRLLRLEYRHHDAVRALEEAERLAAILEPRVSAGTGGRAAMIGPAPCFFSKLEGRYRWQIVLRGGDPGAYLEGLRLEDWRIEIDPLTLL